MESVFSKRGKQKFESDGYLYTFEKLSAKGDVEFWRCEGRQECRARIHVVKEVVKRINFHTHEEYATIIEAAKIITAIKSRSLNTMESTAQVINTCLENASVACQGTLPPMPALKKVVQRSRNVVHRANGQPVDLETLIII